MKNYDVIFHSRIEAEDYHEAVERAMKRAAESEDLNIGAVWDLESLEAINAVERERWTAWRWLRERDRFGLFLFLAMTGLSSMAVFQGQFMLACLYFAITLGIWVAAQKDALIEELIEHQERVGEIVRKARLGGEDE